MTIDQPVACSALIEVHKAASAQIETIDGWEVATSYPSAGLIVGNALIDISHQCTCEVSSNRLDELFQQQLGQPVAIRSIQSIPGSDIYRLTQTRAIIKGSCSLTGAIDVTGGWACVALHGPDMHSILSRVTSVDLREKILPVSTCCQGSLFGINTLFGRFDNHFKLHVCPDSLEFLWDLLLDAGHEFDLKPAGWNFYQSQISQEAML